MKAGKISETVLKRSVLKQLHTVHPSVRKGPGVGIDSSVFQIGAGQNLVLSMNPVTLGITEIGTRGVYKALNNIAVMGAEPIGVMASLLLPTCYSENELRDLIHELDKACEETSATVLGGHTEVVRGITQPIITITGAGIADQENDISSGNAKPGMDVIVTKWIGLEGTAILATEKEEALGQRYSQPFINKAKNFLNYISIQSEAAVATKSGVGAMHDISQGGIFAALWEMAESAGVGLEIDLKKIPIRQETVEICEFFDLNPYKILSGGSLLIAAEDGNTLVRELERIGVSAVIVGKTTDSNDRVLLCEDERRFLELPQTDELHKGMEK